MKVGVRVKGVMVWFGVGLWVRVMSRFRGEGQVYG